MKKKLIIIFSIIISVIILGGIATLVYFKIAFISKKEVKNIIVKDINTQENKIKFDSIDLELDKKYYEVEIYYNKIEYEYKIDATNGNIIYSDFVKLENNKSDIINTNITIDDAKKIALDAQKVQETEVVFTKIETDTNNNVTIYEIEYQYGGYEYEYEINTIGGITSFKFEPINK